MLGTELVELTRNFCIDGMHIPTDVSADLIGDIMSLSRS